MSKLTRSILDTPYDLFLDHVSFKCGDTIHYACKSKHQLSVLKTTIRTLLCINPYIDSEHNKLSDAVAIPYSDLMKTKGFGRKTMSLWVQILKEYGMYVGMSYPEQQSILLSSNPDSDKGFDFPEQLTVERCVKFLNSCGFEVVLTKRS